jgi:hypothetical protein
MREEMSVARAAATASSSPAATSARAWDGLMLACAVGAAIPLWLGRYLPFADLPEHVAAIATLRHWWDPAWNPNSTFVLALGNTQYMLYYVVGALLSFPLGNAERANLIVLSATAIAIPYSLRALLRATQGDERTAIFAAPLFWSKPLLIGLLQYVAAIPFILWGLSLAIRQAQHATRRRTALLAALGVLLFYLHLSALIFFLVAAALCFLLWPAPSAGAGVARLLSSRIRTLWPKLAWMIPAVVLCASWLLTSAVIRPSAVGWSESVGVYFQPPSVALAQLPESLLAIWRANENKWPMVAWVAAWLLLMWPSRERVEDYSRLWSRRAAAALVGLALVFYFAAPYAIGWLWWLNARHAILAALLLPAIARAPTGRKGTVSLSIAALVALWVAVSATLHVAAFQREVDGFERVLLHARPKQRMFSIIFEEDSRVARFIPYHHFGSYYRARLGGIAEYSFANLPQSPFRYRPEVAPPLRPESWEWDPTTFRNDVDGAYYDYVLVRGTVDPFAGTPAGPEWRLAAREGLWALYEKETTRPSQ